MALIPEKPKIAADYAESFSSKEHREVLKKIAIIGCGYVGTGLARYWKRQ